MLQIEDLTYRIAGRTLFDGASAFIARGWKVGLVGRNGTGKSTLLKLIQEEAGNPGGAIRIPPAARLGFVAQEAPPIETPVLAFVLEAHAEMDALLKEADIAEDPQRIADIHLRLGELDAYSAEARASSILTGLGFDQDDLQRPCREFSGGWRMRAALAGVLFAQPDILVLDEPTNYLDLEGAAWLEEYLSDYPETVIVVSHDRDMLNRSVTHILALNDSKLEVHPGGYDTYLRKRAERAANLGAQKAKQLGENVVGTGNYEVTGDTIKFDSYGKLLDGQHRLTACAASSAGLTSHVVFGLPPAIFDVLDLGSKRTVSDALELEGFGNAFILSGALNFVRKYEQGQAHKNGGANPHSHIAGVTPREAIALLSGDYADLSKWVKVAERIQKTYKYPPSIVCGVLYLAARNTSERRVREFADAWTSGTRDGVNKNFDDLARRFNTIRSGNNGVISRGVMAALMIITWNYWNAGLPLTARALSWSRSLKFPEIEGDPKVAARKARAYEAKDSSLNASCLRILQAIRRFSDAKGVCSVPAQKLADQASVSIYQVRYLLGQLVRDGFLSISTPAQGPNAAKHSITTKGFSALTRTPLPEEAVALA
jgi:ABC-type multidrug transport system ATPase subunit